MHMRQCLYKYIVKASIGTTLLLLFFSVWNISLNHKVKDLYVNVPENFNLFENMEYMPIGNAVYFQHEIMSESAIGILKIRYEFALSKK